MANNQAKWMPGDSQDRVTCGHREQGSDQQPWWGYFSSPAAPCAPQTCELVHVFYFAVFAACCTLSSQGFRSLICLC